MVNLQLSHAGHAGGTAGGFSVELLLLAAGAVVVAYLVRPSKSGSTQLPIVLLLVAAGAVTAAILTRSSGGSVRSDNVSLRILEPSNGAEVPAGEPIDVQVDVVGSVVATSPEDDGGHLHIFVDGRLQQMPYTTDVVIALEPGSHELMVEFVDEQHLPLDPPVVRTIEVTATKTA